MIIFVLAESAQRDFVMPRVEILLQGIHISESKKQDVIPPYEDELFSKSLF